MKRRRTRILLGIGIGVAAVAIAALVVVRTILLPRYRFPTPNGQFGIGTITLHLVDSDREEILGPNPGGPRALMAQLWYPAATDGEARGEYIADAAEVAPALAGLFRLPGFTLNNLSGVTTNAVENAPVAGTERFPVVVMLSGTGGFRQSTTFLVEHLVSNGFVVVGVDQPFASIAVVFPDGRVAEMSPLEELRPLVRQSYMPKEEPPQLNGAPLEHGIIPFLGQDVSFVIDELERLDSDEANPLAGRLALDKIGVAGVSLGGIVAGEVAREDSRVRATLIMDAAVPLRTAEAGLDAPAMWITRPPETMRLERERAGGWPEEEIEAHHRTMRETFERLRAPGYFVQIPDISHIDFTDAPLWAPVLGWLGLSGPKDVAYAHGVTEDYTLTFFLRHLAGLEEDTSFARLVEVYPEVSLEIREP